VDEPEVTSLTAGPIALAARSWSGGSGRPVLLVHGLSSNARLWDEVAERLAADGHPVVAVDLRGHGASAAVADPDPGPAGGLGATRVAAADLAEVLTTLGWAGAVVAGQSWGGNVVLQLAADRPDLVHGLALVDGGWLHLGDQWDTIDAAWDVLAPPVFDGLTAAQLRDGITGRHPDWSARAVAGAAANLQERPDGTVAPWLDRERHRMIVASMLAHRPRELYPQVRCRTLLLAAVTTDEQPARKRAQLDEALAALAHGELVEFPGADHDLHAQHPDQVAQLIGALA
jgi:pimeloyl-ACP methyl ester carboxylesterase